MANAAASQSPEFSLRALDGPPVTSESLRGEVVVLAFGASWLPLTRNQMESLKKLADQYAGRGVAVYWVSTESDSPKSKNFADDNQLRELGRTGLRVSPLLVLKTVLYAVCSLAAGVITAFFLTLLGLKG